MRVGAFKCKCKRNRRIKCKCKCSASESNANAQELNQMHLNQMQMHLDQMQMLFYNYVCLHSASYILLTYLGTTINKKNLTNNNNNKIMGVSLVSLALTAGSHH